MDAHPTERCVHARDTAGWFSFSVVCEVSSVCGRYAATKDPAKLAAEFDAWDATGEPAGRGDPNDSVHEVDYNVAPTKSVPAVVTRHPRDAEGNPDRSRTERSLRAMRWGLVPYWAKDASSGAKMINARAESAASKPAYKASVASKRCLLPADGWYEWRREGETKQPFYVTRGDGASLAFAGLWSAWRDPERDGVLVTCAVLTTEATDHLADVHPRMPMLLPEEHWARWLDPDVGDVGDLLATPDLDLVRHLELRPVSATVNNVRNNGAELVRRVEPDTRAPAELDGLFDVEDIDPARR